MNPLILIPARLHATRLPGKPLADIGGVPMIVHVWRRAMESGVGRVAVATDDVGIQAAVEAAGATAIMTRAEHPSGSDRIFEALSIIDPDGAHDVIVNLQGDLPTLDPALVQAVTDGLAYGVADIATLAAEITVAHERNDPNVVKVVGTSIEGTSAAYLKGITVASRGDNLTAKTAKPQQKWQAPEELKLESGDKSDQHGSGQYNSGQYNSGQDVLGQDTAGQYNLGRSEPASAVHRLRALYFTRATAPYGDGPLYHHIGIYAYRRPALERFIALPPSPLELREKLEQLRALEAGMRIDVAIVATVPLGVDTPADLDRARAILAG